MIRNFLLEDLTDVNNLLETFSYKLIDKSLENPFLNILVYYDNYIKGVLVYQYIFDRIEIDYIVVNEKDRNLGIASQLLNYLENKYDNIDNITLEVRESNIVARNYYIKNGFKEAGYRKNYYNDESGILMLKNLGE